MARFHRFLAAALGVIVVAAACTSAPAQTGVTNTGPGSSQVTQELKIGMITSLSGYIAKLGAENRDAEMLVFNRANANNEIPGIRLKVIVVDDKGDAATAVSAAQKLMSDGVAVIIGPPIGSGMNALAPILDPKGMPALFMGSFSAQLAASAPSCCFGLFPVPLEEATAAWFLIKKHNAKSLAIIHDSNTYGTGVADEVVKLAQAGGVNVLRNESYASSDTDMTAQMTRIRAAKPDVLLQVGGGAAPAIIARERYELGMTDVPLLGTEAMFSNGDAQFIQVAGAKAAEGVEAVVFNEQVWDTLPTSDPRQANLVKAVKDYIDTTGGQMGYGVGFGYDGAQLLVNAIKRAGSTKSADLRAALESTDYKGAVCHAKYSPKNHVACTANDYVVSAVVNGKLVYTGTVGQ